MNFFDRDCQEPTIDEALFGICDDQNGTKAYTNVGDSTKWIATVQNNRKITLTFTAVDNCVILGNEEQNRMRCDGMLTSVEHLYFIELKKQKKNWREHAINQLESTIQFFLENHDASIFKHKKAFACNRKHGRFQVIDNELSKRFFTKYRFRIDVQTEVLII